MRTGFPARLRFLAFAALALPGCTYLGAGLAVSLFAPSDSGAVPPPPAARLDPPERQRSPVVTLPVTLGPGTRSLTVEIVDPAPRPATLVAVSPGTLDGPGALRLDLREETVVSVTWDSTRDLPGPRENILLRFTPSGPGGTAPPVDYGPFTVGNTPPEVEIVSPASGASVDGNTTLQLRLFDEERDTTDLALLVWAPGTATRTLQLAAPATLTGLEATPRADGGRTLTIVWDSEKDLGRHRTTATIEARPSDPDPSTVEVPVEVTVTVENNEPPTVFLEEPVTNPDDAGTVVLLATVSDREADPIDLVVQWRRPGELFPDLTDLTDPALRRAVLADPAARAARQIVSVAAPLAIEGQVEAVSDGPALVRASALLATGGLADPTLPGRAFILMRDRQPAVVATLPQAAGPVAVVGGGPTSTGAALVGVADGSLRRVDLDAGGAPQTLATGLGDPASLAVTSDGRVAFVTDRAGRRLVRVDLKTGTTTEVVTGLAGPEGVALLPGDRAVVTVDGLGGGGFLLQVDLATGATSTLLAGLQAPRGVLAVEGGRALLLAEHGAGCLLHLDLATGRATPILSASPGWTDPAWLAPGPDDRRVLVTSDDGSGSGSSQIFLFHLAARRAAQLASSRSLVGGAVRARDGALVFTTGAGEVSVGGGVAQARTVLGTSLQPPALRLDRNLSPVPAGGERWRALDLRPALGVTALRSSRAGVRHRVRWDPVADGLPEDPVELAVTPFDGASGLRVAARVSKVVHRLAPGPTDLPDTSRPGGAARVAGGDLDGDGLLDVVVCQPDGGSGTALRVWLQAGHDRFGTSSFPVFAGGPARDVRVADVDGDGRPDLVVAADTVVTVLWNTGPSSGGEGRGGGGGVGFSLQTVLSAGAGGVPAAPGFSAVHLVDLDWDGHLDLAAVLSRSGQLAVVRQTSSARTFEATSALLSLASTGTPALVAAGLGSGDLDGDGRLDLVATAHEAGALAIFLQAVGGSFPTAPTVSLQPRSGGGAAPVDLAVADLDRDGDLDLVSANAGTDSVTVFLQGPGGWPAQPSVVLQPGAGVLGAPSALAIGDVDGDGRLDIACAARDADDVVVFRQQAPGRFGPDPFLVRQGQTAALGSPAGIALCDLGASGRPTLVVASGASHGVAVFRPLGPGAYGSSPLQVVLAPPADASPRALCVGDLTGDGFGSVASANGAASGNVTAFGPGLPGVLEGQPYLDVVPAPAPGGGNAVSDVQVGDWDQDGDLDLVVSARDLISSPPAVWVSLFRQEPGGLSRTPETLVRRAFPTSSPPVLAPICLGDANLDGRLDLALLGPEGVELFWQTASGTLPAVASHAASTTLWGAGTRLALSDLDQDGDLDVAALVPSARVVVGFFQRGAPGQLDPGEVLVTATYDPEALALADLDQDGDLDLALTGPFAGSSVRSAIYGYFQVLPGVFTGPQVQIAPTRPLQKTSVGLVGADLDGDGQVDLAAANAGSSSVTLFRQLVPGVFEVEPYRVLRFSTGQVAAPAALRVVDLDGDGEAEIVVADDEQRVTTPGRGRIGIFGTRSP